MGGKKFLIKGKQQKTKQKLTNKQYIKKKQESSEAN